MLEMGKEKINKILAEIGGAISYDAFEWVDEECRRKLKKYPDSVDIYIYWCISLLKAGHYGKMINKACDALSLEASSEERLILCQLLNKAIEKNTVQQLTDKARQHIKRNEAKDEKLEDKAKLQLLRQNYPEIFGEPLKDDENIAGLNMLFEGKDAGSYFYQLIQSGKANDTTRAGLCFCVGNLREAAGICERVIKEREDVFCKVLRAIIFFEEGKYEDALRLLDSNFEEVPLAFELKGSCFLKLHMLKEAFHCYGKALEARPDNVQSLLGKAICLLDLGKPKRALKVLNSGLEKQPKHLDLLKFKGLCFEEMGMLNEAFPVYKKLLKIGSRPEDLLRLAQLYQLTGEDKRALLCYDEILKVVQDNQHAWFGKLLSSLNLNKEKEIMLCCKKLLEISDDEKTLDFILPIFIEAGLDAEGCCRKILLKNPNNQQALTLMLKELMGKGKHKEAFEYLNKADENYFTLKNKGLCLYKMHDFVNAREFIKRALETKSSTLLRKKLAICERKIEQLKQEIEKANLLLKDKGIELAKIGKFKEAMECFDKLSTADKDFYKYKGICCTSLKRYKEALASFEQSEEDEETLLNRFASYAALNDYEHAKRCIEKLLKTSTKEHILSMVKTGRGLALELFGKFKESIKEYCKDEALESLKRLLQTLEKNKLYNELLFCCEAIVSLSRTKRNIKDARQLLQRYGEFVKVDTKSRLSFADEKRAVVCDSNIWLLKMRHDLNIKDDSRCEAAFNEFKRFEESGDKICILKVVESEVKNQASKLFKDAGQEDATLGERIEEQVAKLKGKYDINRLIKTPLDFSDELNSVTDFYKTLRNKVLKVTEKKLKPFLGEEKIKKLGLRAGGSLPEHYDLIILAQCLKLNDSLIKGVSRIVLFTDDADFSEFTREIKEQLNIQICSL